MKAHQLSFFDSETNPNVPANISDQPALPDGWRWVKLAGAAQINPKLSRKDIPLDLPVSFVPMKQVSEESGQVNLSEQRRFEEVKKGFTPFEDGDVILAKITPCMENGKTAVVEGLLNGIGFGSTEFHVFRCSSTLLNNRFLFYHFVQRHFRHEAEANMTGAVGQRRVPKFFLEEYRLPLPPLPEQQRIVAKIEELFSEIDAGIREVEAALLRLKTYRQAVLNEFIDDDSLDTARLGNIASIRGGVTKGRDLDGQPTISLPYLRVANVQDGFLNLREMKYIDVLQSDLDKYRLIENDILFTEGGDKDKLGRGTIWRAEIADCIHQNHIFRARVDQRVVNPIYVTYASKTTKAKRYFYKVAKQTTNLASINMTQLCDLEIPLPDLATQTQIVQEIEARLSEADALEKTLRTELQRAERLRQSVLKQAFAGTLLKTDVPASLSA